MSETRGKVGSQELAWQGAPRSSEGASRVRVGGGQPIDVRWKRDAHGIWIELPYGSFGFDFEGEAGEDGRIQYRVTERNGDGEWIGQAFLRAGEESSVQAASGRKKGLRIRAQMPGKILRVL